MKRIILKISLVPALIVGCSSLVLAAPDPDPVWQVVGSPGFGGSGYNAGAEGLTMALDSNSIPHVAFSDDGNYDKATVMKYNGSSWAQLGGTLPSLAETFSTSIVIDRSGTPYVAYTKSNADDGKYWANVVSYNGSSWGYVGSADFALVATTHLAIDSSGTPFVSYRDVDLSYAGTVKKLVGSSWLTVGSAGFAKNPAIVLDSQDTPYVVYKYEATVKKFDGTSWVTVGGENFASGTASYCSMAINSKDEPYVAFKDGDNSDKISVMKYNGVSWVLVGTAGFSSTTTYYIPSIAIDGSDTPYIAYSDYDGSTQEAMVMKFNGSSWEVVGEARFSTGEVADISMAINTKGVPYVSYRDGNIYNRATVMYAPSITCAHKNQGDGTGECIPSTTTPDPGDYPDILDRNYVQGNINVDGDRTADTGWQGDYPTLCRDGASNQGDYTCP